jgi:hypothetical protein
MSSDKGPPLAIEIASKTDMQLRLAGKVDPEEQAYFKERVLPQIDGKQIQYLGEANHERKNAFDD